MRLRPLKSHHLKAVSSITGTVDTKIASGPLCTAHLTSEHVTASIKDNEPLATLGYILHRWIDLSPGICNIQEFLSCCQSGASGRCIRSHTCNSMISLPLQLERKIGQRPLSPEKAHSLSYDTSFQQKKSAMEQQPSSCDISCLKTACEALNAGYNRATKSGRKGTRGNPRRQGETHPDLHHVMLRQQLNASSPALFTVVPHQHICRKNQNESLAGLAHALTNSADGVGQGLPAIITHCEDHCEGGDRDRVRNDVHEAYADLLLLLVLVLVRLVL